MTPEGSCPEWDSLVGESLLEHQAFLGLLELPFEPPLLPPPAIHGEVLNPLEQTARVDIVEVRHCPRDLGYRDRILRQPHPSFSSDAGQNLQKSRAEDEARCQIAVGEDDAASKAR